MPGRPCFGSIASDDRSELHIIIDPTDLKATHVHVHDDPEASATETCTVYKTNYFTVAGCTVQYTVFATATASAFVNGLEPYPIAGADADRDYFIDEHVTCTPPPDPTPAIIDTGDIST